MPFCTKCSKSGMHITLRAHLRSEWPLVNAQSPVWQVAAGGLGLSVGVLSQRCPQGDGHADMTCAPVQRALTAYICKVSVATCVSSLPLPALWALSASSTHLLFSCPDRAGVAPSPWRHLLILPVLARVIFRGHLPCHPPWGRLCFPRMAVTHPLSQCSFCYMVWTLLLWSGGLCLSP